MVVPRFYQLFNPSLKALRELGGSASIQELEDQIARNLSLTEEDLAVEKNPGRSLFAYRLAWARSYLKNYGVIDNSKRGVWSLTATGAQTETVDVEVVKKHTRRRTPKPKDDPGDVLGEDDDTAAEWKAELLEVLLSLKPDQFERLCQRMLRESGFTQVQVTGKSGDGGIDGTGTVKIGGLLSFPILFQCKRYQGSVGPSTVRDFRGSMTGRVDRGLILTTGVFSRDARCEADRDGAFPVDLVDRDLLLDKLKELGLGVKVDLVEDVSIEAEWFRGI